MLVGRDTEIREYKRLLEQACTPLERNKWAYKLRQIMAEANNEKIAGARAHLIDAYRKNDIRKVEEVSDYIKGVKR